MIMIKNIWSLIPIRNKNLDLNKILIEKHKDKLENPNFERYLCSRTAISVHKVGQDSIKLMKWIAHYDRSYHENINYYDLMESVLKYLNEISYWWILRRGKRSSILNSSHWKQYFTKTRSTKVSQNTISSKK